MFSFFKRFTNSKPKESEKEVVSEKRTPVAEKKEEKVIKDTTPKRNNRTMSTTNFIPETEMLGNTTPKVRVSGRDWKVSKKPVRNTNKLGTKYEQRRQREMQLKALKQQEQEKKDEKLREKQEHLDKIKERREAKAEKERYELMAKTMHAKRVERIRRREKRNKMLKER